MLSAQFLQRFAAFQIKAKVENVYWDQQRMTQSSETCYKYKNVKILALVRLYCLSNGATLCLKVHKNWNCCITVI